MRYCSIIVCQSPLDSCGKVILNIREPAGKGILCLILFRIGIVIKGGITVNTMLILSKPAAPSSIGWMFNAA